ncbi:MAG: ATP-binding protein [Gammaproteobacteria bacterium]|nr:ATP-binding protein [Gammaproteobacteria bacterium]
MKVNLGRIKNSVYGDKLGLIMVVATLLVIIFLIGMILQYQKASREEHNRIQGLSLIRALAKMPYEQLVSENNMYSAFQIVRIGQDNPDFAYVVLVDKAGIVLNEAVAQGVIIPAVNINDDPSDWLGERILPDVNGKGVIQEYHAPVLVNGELMGHVRIGYKIPGYGISDTQLVLFASMALPVFLLTTIFYFLVRREIKPVREVNNILGQMIRENKLQKIEITASGELADFMDSFNRYIEFTRNQVTVLEGHKTDLQASSKLLSYKRKRVELVLDSLPEGIVVINESGEVVFCNDKFGSLLSIDTQGVIGNGFRDICDHEEIIEFISVLQNKNVAGYSDNTMECRLGDNNEIVIMISAYPVFSQKEENVTQGMLVVFRDVTHERHISNSSDEFITQIAHELKTPVNVLSMYSEALMDEDNANDEFRIEAYNVIYDEVDRLSLLINNLLSLKKINDGTISLQRKSVKVYGFLEDAVNSVSRSGKNKNIKFILNVDKDISSIKVDKELLRLAVNNLLTNAIKYNKESGEVTLSCHESDNSLVISVKDTGIGIDDDDIDHVFDKFYRSSNDEVRERTGHGLGLSLAKEIVDLHRGRLLVTSEIGVGSEFTIVFDKEFSTMQKAI